MRQRIPVILIRLIVGVVFMTEGILMFMRPGELGADRFKAIGLPFPHVLAQVLGGVEIGAGAAVLLNFYAGDAAMLLLVVTVFAIVTTKVPILLGPPPGHFSLARLSHYGWFNFLHEARTGLCMLAATLAVLVDSGLQGKRKRPG
jgi:uncharacterized membrane protein YphA (DoxX/SURF4 family)